MQYEVLTVRSAELEDVVAEITLAYEDVAQNCGRIVAGHALACTEDQ